MKALHLLSLLSTTALAVSAAMNEATAEIEASMVVRDAAQAASVCGKGYSLENVVPLPSLDTRLGTLYAFSSGKGKSCMVLDNNVGEEAYMSLRMCDEHGKNCKMDSGAFGQYAGPVSLSKPDCAKVTANMGSSADNLYIDFSSDHVFACD